MREFVEQRVADGVPMRCSTATRRARWRRSCPTPSSAPRSARSTPSRPDPLRPGLRGGRAAGRGAESSKGVRRRTSRDARAAGSSASDDIGADHRPATSSSPPAPGARPSPPSSGSTCRSSRCASRSSRREPMPPRLDVVYGPAAVKQYAIFQELPSFDASLFETDLEERLGLLLLEGLPEGGRLVPARDRHGLPGLRLAARTWRGLAHHRGDGARPAPARGAASPGPGPASCR